MAVLLNWFMVLLLVNCILFCPLIVIGLSEKILTIKQLFGHQQQLFGLHSPLMDLNQSRVYQGIVGKY